MKLKLAYIGFMLCLVSQAQTISFAPGINYGRFYDLSPNEGHFHAEYKPQVGFCFGVEIKEIKIDTLIKIGFALNYQNYGGSFLVRNGGMGGSISHEGTVSQGRLGIEFYPFNFRFFKHLRLRVGTSMNILLHKNLSGIKRWWYMGTPPNHGTMELTKLDNFMRPITWGAHANIGYEFEIGKIVIEPRYAFYTSFYSEFSEIQANTKSMRHTLQLAVGYRLK